MFRSRLGFTLATLFALPAAATAQVAPFDLAPGDVVFSDTASASILPAVRVLHRDGTIDTLLEGGPLGYPSGVAVDRDGTVLVVDYHGDGNPANAVLRLRNGGGRPQIVTAGSLDDCFFLARGPFGELFVADGYNGIVSVDENGNVAPHAVTPDPRIAIGLAEQPSGNLFLAEAPRPGDPGAGLIWHVHRDGTPQAWFADPDLMRSPQDLALAPDGSLLVTHFDQYAPAGQEEPRLLRVRPNRTAEVLADGGLLRKPKGIAVDSRGTAVIADTDDQSLLRWSESGGLERLVGDLDDGIDDGKPLNRPFGVATVPDLWVRADGQPRAARPFTAVIEGMPRFRGQPLLLLAASFRDPFELATIWPGSPRTLALSPYLSSQIHGVLPADGAPLELTRSVPTHAGGMALHLQAINGLRQEPSNVLSFRIRP